MIDPIPVDALLWPYVAWLRIRYPKTPDNKVSVGTGCLIGPRVILTAGHVVYDYYRGGWASLISVTMGANPRFTISTSIVRTTQHWVDVDSRTRPLESAVDYGVVVLSQAVDMQVRPLAAETASGTMLGSRVLNHAGYPSTENGTLYGARAKPVEVTETRIAYPIQTLPGQSGGPVYDYDPATKVRTVRGIHTSFIPEKGGSAVRINEGVKRLIDQWLMEFRPT